MKYHQAIALFIILFPGWKSVSEVHKKENEIVIPALTVDITDTALRFSDGYYYFRKKLFSGVIVEYDSYNNIHRRTGYWQGKEEGVACTYYPGGSLCEERHYHAGEKDGVHTGWWENGNLRFEYHFLNGGYDGDWKEWYSNGQVYKFLHYTKGIDEWGKGWRENGKLYMSYVMKDGRRYGLINPNLCYTVKNGKGEYEK